jgi:hypothetical protein
VYGLGMDWPGYVLVCSWAMLGMAGLCIVMANHGLGMVWAHAGLGMGCSGYALSWA